MKINLQDVSFKNIKNIIIVATFATIIVHTLLLNSIFYIYDVFAFFKGSWPFLIVHVILAVVCIVLMIKAKEGRIFLGLTFLANLLAFCWIGFFFFPLAFR